jgi:hypothetical protein
MTDIEAKAMALVREVLAERDLSDKRLGRREVSPYTEALCRAIEQHEAFKQEVSDVLHDLSDMAGEHIPYGLMPRLRELIIPKPKPDPLVEVLDELGWRNNSDEWAADLRAALEARGLEIKEQER